jgi:hypothetical protein
MKIIVIKSSHLLEQEKRGRYLLGLKEGSSGFG